MQCESNLNCMDLELLCVSIIGRNVKKNELNVKKKNRENEKNDLSKGKLL